jgi:hypothetical protein
VSITNPVPVKEIVLYWRFDQLIRLGFDPINADLLAAKTDVDLGRIRELIAAGCPTQLAVRILT